jgi:hypothetical protein
MTEDEVRQVHQIAGQAENQFGFPFKPSPPDLP